MLDEARKRRPRPGREVNVGAVQPVLSGCEEQCRGRNWTFLLGWLLGSGIAGGVSGSRGCRRLGIGTRPRLVFRGRRRRRLSRRRGRRRFGRWRWRIVVVIGGSLRLSSARGPAASTRATRRALGRGRLVGLLGGGLFFGALFVVVVVVVGRRLGAGSTCLALSAAPLCVDGR